MAVKKTTVKKVTTKKPVTTKTSSTTKRTATVSQSINKAKDTYVAQTPTSYVNTDLLGADTLSKQYGVEYDRGAIEKVLQGSVKAAYDQQMSDQRNAEDTYYQQLASTAATQYDQARQDRGAALISGASAGARAANQLSAVLGVTQNSMEGMNTLSQQRKQIADAQSLAYAAATSSALDKANAAGQALATIDTTRQANLVAQRSAELEYNSGINQNNANHAINRYTADSSVYGSKLTSDATKQAAASTAAAQVAAAKIAAAAAGSYGGGGGGSYYSNAGRGNSGYTSSSSKGSSGKKKSAPKSKATYDFEYGRTKTGALLRRTKWTDAKGKVTYGSWQVDHASYQGSANMQYNTGGKLIQLNHS